MIFAFYILAAMLIYFSFKSFRGGINYLNYFRQELAKPPSNFAPIATVIVPCKGLDQGLKENLTALLVQDYPNYEVVFVVDDERDEAVAVIRSIAADAKLIVAPKAANSSQKVENLREAGLHAAPESKVFVFADSDARPSRDWLRYLVAPLRDETVGVATGYRWFISERPSFASDLRSAWNASIASALGPGLKNEFCWGGSMAIRRETFERLGVREQWLGTVSDDFVLARIVRDAGLTIYFVPQALTASIENCSFREMLEFTTRQMKLTRVYAPKLWKLSCFGAGLFNVVMVSAIAVATFSRDTFATTAAIFTISAVAFFSIGKSWLRLSAVRLVLTGHAESVRKQTLPQLTLWAVTPAVFFAKCLAALFSRRIEWRGLSYTLVSPTETIVLPKR
jgi:cellulose synthase/poly-beta-1,6-N-acetylglucosamine synthase-like glycosyltransferase